MRGETRQGGNAAARTPRRAQYSDSLAESLHTISVFGLSCETGFPLFFFFWFKERCHADRGAAAAAASSSLTPLTLAGISGVSELPAGSRPPDLPLFLFIAVPRQLHPTGSFQTLERPSCFSFSPFRTRNDTRSCEHCPARPPNRYLALYAGEADPTCLRQGSRARRRKPTRRHQRARSKIRPLDQQ